MVKRNSQLERGQPMEHLQSLKLLHSTVKEMHLQENNSLTLSLGSRSHKLLLSTLYIL